jgi:exodeoxyribonuclease VII large subunit
VIIITRGGGSIEDLLPFSDEDLIRAVAATTVPVVSAIGHEQDSPLLDLVADVRASTPTDAARRVVPDVAEQFALIEQLRNRARRCLTGRVDHEIAWLAGVRSRPALAAPDREVDRRTEALGALTQRTRRCVAGLLDRAADDVAHTRARLLALSPAATLSRGYAVVQQADGHVVRAAAEVSAGDRLTLRFAADQVTAVAEAANPANDGENAQTRGTRRTARNA